uniref:Uncharacterized protein n=1 Tax=Candidatus Kentrum sp. DK TaxID=2126562 RepID=A0A450SVR1_9GAMM|nr:MAG: hypothetical protein BECKDK2373B_GA0170837_107011 [Candidatus Kentron sp. DK]
MNHQTRDAKATIGDGAPPKGIFGKGIFFGKGRSPIVPPQGAKKRAKAPDAVRSGGAAWPGKAVIPFDTGYMKLSASPGGELPAPVTLLRVADRFSACALSRHMATSLDTAPNVRIGPIRRLEHHVAALPGAAFYLAGMTGGVDAIVLPGPAEADVAVGDGMGIGVCPVSFFHLHAPGRETGHREMETEYGIGDSREMSVYLMAGDAAVSGERSTLNLAMVVPIRRESVAPLRVPGHPVRDGNIGGIVGGALSVPAVSPVVMGPREDALLLMASACHAIPRMEEGVSVRRRALVLPLAGKGAEAADALIIAREAFGSGDATTDPAAMVPGPFPAAPGVEPAGTAVWANPAPSGDGAPVRISADHRGVIDLVAQQPVEVVISGGGVGDAGASRVVGPEGDRAASGHYDTGDGMLWLVVIGPATSGPAGEGGRAVPPRRKGKPKANRFQPIPRIEVSLGSGEAAAGTFSHCDVTDRPIPATDGAPWTDFIAVPAGNTLRIPARAEILAGKSQGNKGARYPEPLSRRYDGVSLRLPPLGGMPGADFGREPVAVRLVGSGGEDYVAQLVLAREFQDRSLPDVVLLAFREVHAARALAIAPVSGKEGMGETLVLLAGIPTRNSPALPGEAILLENTLAIQEAIAAVPPVTGAWEPAAPQSGLLPSSQGPGAGAPTPVQETSGPFEILLLDPFRWAILQGEEALGNPTWRPLTDARSARADRPWRISDGDLCIPRARVWEVLSVSVEPGS